MEFDLEISNKLLEWTTSKEGIYLVLFILYLSIFLIPSFKGAFLSKYKLNNPVADLFVSICSFMVMLFVIPPILIIGFLLNFLSPEVEV
tara:strand:+ start:495 stop:761 length:267 start_codon:yes stop_codon:yes gene_type:complete